MDFNFQEVFDSMVSVFGDNLKEGGDEALAYGKKVLAERKSDLENISKIYADKLTKLIQEYESQLEDEKTTLESQLLAEQVIVKSTAQKAINAAMDLLVGAVKKVIQL